MCVHACVRACVGVTRKLKFITLQKRLRKVFNEIADFDCIFALITVNKIIYFTV